MTSKRSEGSTLQSTRQVLDELDALMERMLSLPVRDGEEPSPAPAKASLQHPTVAASLTVVEEPPPVPAPEPTPPPSPRAIPIHRPTPVPEKTPAAYGARLAKIETPTLTLNAPPLSAPLTRQPLEWLNDRFDGFASWFGPLGSWVQNGGGRTYAGLAGFGLIAAAMIWLWLDGVRWP